MADWSKILSRGDVEDRRGLAPIVGGGGLGLLGVIAVIAFNMFTGSNVNPALVEQSLNQLQQLQGTAQNSQLQPEEFRGADNYEVFASTVLGSTNDTWQGIFAQNNQQYIKPKLVLFRDGTTSGCGGASSQVGPHYCPVDQTIYIDETFFDVLRQRFGGNSGDVAQAYVIAHEVGHHVQHQLGLTKQVQSNASSIKLELQADCLAGIWAHSVAGLGVFESGEINEAIDASAAVGDDRIQSKVEGQINPETWTHGSSQQRVNSFTTGYSSGQPAQCNL